MNTTPEQRGYIASLDKGRRKSLIENLYAQVLNPGLQVGPDDCAFQAEDVQGLPMERNLNYDKVLGVKIFVDQFIVDNSTALHWHSEGIYLGLTMALSRQGVLNREGGGTIITNS